MSRVADCPSDEPSRRDGNFPRNCDCLRDGDNPSNGDQPGDCEGIVTGLKYV